jgi:hypothetical protein
VDPYRPGAQLEHAAAPATLYVPNGQTDAVALTEPAGQEYPGEHKPLQAAVVKPPKDPYEPAVHKPLQSAVVNPARDPYRPMAQLVHDPAPCKLYDPGGHMIAVALADPSGHLYPAGHSPEHADVLSPGDAPYSPTAQLVHDGAAAKLYVPSTHCPEHSADVDDENPKRPAAQSVHTVLPATL